MITKQGTVIKAQGKTAAIICKEKKAHSKYHKLMTRSQKFLVHDETSSLKVGDCVEVQQCPRISKNKSWKLLQVISSDSSVS